MIGSTAAVMASGVGDVDGPVASDAVVTGASVVPPSPAHLVAQVQADGDVVLSWVRRSRAGWRWIDGVDAPLAEESEAYRVTLDRQDGSSMQIETSSGNLRIAAADRGDGACTVTVRQVGRYGESLPARLTIPAA